MVYFVRSKKNIKWQETINSGISTAAMDTYIIYSKQCTSRLLPFFGPLVNATEVKRKILKRKHLFNEGVTDRVAFANIFFYSRKRIY